MSMNKFLTHCHILFDYNFIDPMKIQIQDIAHHLANCNRYGGSLPLDVHYSVARHSIAMAKAALRGNFKGLDKTEIAYAALMHDASEAYLGDVPKGLKNMLPDYQELESAVTDVIDVAFKVSRDLEVHKIVKELDEGIFIEEVFHFFPNHSHEFNLPVSDIDEKYDIYGFSCGPLSTDIAAQKQRDYDEFLSMWLELSGVCL